MYQVRYLLKEGKVMRTAYHGDDRSVYEQVIQELKERTGIDHLVASVTQTEVLVFE